MKIVQIPVDKEYKSLAVFVHDLDKRGLVTFEKTSIVVCPVIQGFLLLTVGSSAPFVNYTIKRAFFLMIS